MKIAVQGVFNTDLRDVTYGNARFIAELGFKGIGAHINVPAESISEATIAAARGHVADQGLAWLQLWGKYPCIISPDESVRRAGIAQVREICALTARLGVPGVGVRPTSLNPRGDWWPHPDNYLPQTEDRLVGSLTELAVIAQDQGLNVVLEVHQTSTLDTAQTIRRVIDRTGALNMRVNIDVCNFVTDLRTAFHPAPMIREQFALLGAFADTIHLKDYYLEDRLVAHISETVLGTGLMDWATLLTEASKNQANGWLMIEHLPVSLIQQAKVNLNAKLKTLGIPAG
ncbi:MAG: sugar phosphate isomerase/epimerase family protein [Thermoflexales bacterium]